MDQTIISIVSTVLGVVSLFKALTNYNVPETRRNFFGKSNVFAEKANIIENTMTMVFSMMAGASLLLLIANDIYGEIIPERLYRVGHYWLVALGAGVLAFLMIALLTVLGDKVAKRKWLSVGVETYHHVYSTLKGTDMDNAPKRTNERLEIMEKYFELEHSDKSSLQQRFVAIKPFFED